MGRSQDHQDPRNQSITNNPRSNLSNSQRNLSSFMQDYQDPFYPEDGFDDSTRNQLPFGYAQSPNLPDEYDLGMSFSAMDIGVEDTPYVYPPNSEYNYSSLRNIRVNSAGMYYGPNRQLPVPTNPPPPCYGYVASFNRGSNPYVTSFERNPPYYGSGITDLPLVYPVDSVESAFSGLPGYDMAQNNVGYNSTNNRTRSNQSRILGNGFHDHKQSRFGGSNGNNGFYDHSQSSRFVGTNGFHDHQQSRFGRSNGFHQDRNQSRFGNGNGFHDEGSDSVIRPSWVENSSMEELMGKILIVAEEQQGVRALQKKIEQGSREDIEILFSEIKDHLNELICHQSGNYLIQTLCEFCNENQMTQLVLLITSNDRTFVTACLDMHGTRVIQKMIEHITTARQRAPIVSALRRITIPLTKNSNGNHVIQHCLKFFAPDEKMHILNVVADKCVEIAMDRSGCCVIQQCIKEADGETVHRLISPIVAEAVTLSEHPYGNYVVQYLLGQRRAFATSAVLGRLFGHFVQLSTNKYGSNVVEKCLRESGTENATLVINELVRDPEQFMMVVLNPYGNYVAQSAIFTAKGGLRHKMIGLIQDHYAYLHSHPHGKRVLACAKPHHRSHHRM